LANQSASIFGSNIIVISSHARSLFFEVAGTAKSHPQPTPGGGAGVPTEGGSAEQPIGPQDDQNDNQGGGITYYQKPGRTTEK
jgi:hypothetical protein